MNPILRITDGTKYINLLKAPYGINEWTPNVAGLKNDGIWQSSPFADGRRLAFYKYTNIIDQFSMIVHGSTQNSIIAAIRELRNLLDDARDYWSNSVSNTPVWIEARGDCETEIRYAVIHDYRLPTDDDPYITPFAGSSRLAMDDLTLIIEHTFWQEEVPGTDTCHTLEITGTETEPYYHEWTAGTLTHVSQNTYSPDNGNDDLPGTYNLTWEAWVYPTDNTGDHVILAKSSGLGAGWAFITTGGALEFQADFATDAHAVSNETLTLNTWQHVAATLNLATGQPRMFIDGTEVTYAIQVNAAGAYGADSGGGGWYLTLGSYDSYPTSEVWAGRISSWRISKSLRYAGAFTPDPLLEGFGYDNNVIIQTTGNYWTTGLSTAAPALTAEYLITNNNYSQFVAIGENEYEYSGCDLQVMMGAPVTGYAQMESSPNYDLTHEDVRLYYYDASITTYIPVVTFPFTMPAFAAGDYLYVFSYNRLYSLMFEVGGTAVQMTNMQYWNGGGWANMNFWNLPDYPATTDGLLRFGRSLALGAEASTNLVGVPGYYYRITLTHTAGTIVQRPIMPTRVNPVLNNVNLNGDIDALLRLWGYHMTTGGVFHKVLFCSRSTSRGTFFPNWLFHKAGQYNAADDYYESGIVSQAYGAGVTSNQQLYPNYDTDMVTGLSGRYRVFARCWTTAGSDGDLEVRFDVGLGAIVRKRICDYLPVLVGQGKYVDCGLVDLTSLRTDYYENSYEIEMDVRNNTGAGITLYMVDLLLMPADEMYFEFETGANDYGIAGFDVNPTEFPKYPRSVFSNTYPAYTIPINQLNTPALTAARLPFTTPGNDQYLFALGFTLSGGAWYLNGYNALTVEGRKVSRYHSMRGNA